MLPRRRCGIQLHTYRPDSERRDHQQRSETVCIFFSLSNSRSLTKHWLAHRIDVGGKLLTNYLKELVSYRHWYMMDQTSVMERAKESACYVSNQWENDWEAAKCALSALLAVFQVQSDIRPPSSANTNNTIVRTFVLPDFTPDSKNKLGYVRTGQTPPPTPPPGTEEADVNNPPAPPEEEQLLYMCNERFTVPEVLFTPTTIGAQRFPVTRTGHSLTKIDGSRAQPSRTCGIDRKLDQYSAGRAARNVLEQHCLRRGQRRLPRLRRTTVSVVAFLG